MSYAIKTDKLTKYYGKERGIIDLNLEIEDGEFFGFIGPNGAGKSTTIRTLLGMINSTSGSASIFNKDIKKDKIEILKNVGYLPSESFFYNGMTVKDIIKFSASLRKKWCDEQAKILCNKLDLDTSRKVNELSFGNRKKVGIVCALQHKPSLLILDEPTSGLDPLMQKEFFSILKEYNNDGVTIFLSSHILSEIQHNCKRSAIIRDGKLIACDRVDNLSKTSAKRVTIHGNFNLDILNDIKDIQKVDDGVSFLYNGDINFLIQILSKVNVKDLSISEPDLDEIFMHYYKSEEKKNVNN